MEKFLDELILSERKKRKEKVLDEQIDLERDLPEQYLQTVVMSDKATSIKIPAFMNDLPEKLAEQKYEFEPKPQIIKSTQNGCEFPYKSRVMGTSEPLKPLKAPYMARNPVKWGFFRLKGQEIPLKI